MKFKLADLRMMRGALQILSQKEIPIRISWKIAKFLKRVDEELLMVEQERVKYIKKYGSDAGDSSKVDKEKAPEFIKEFSQFLNAEVEIEFDAIPISELSGLNFSSSVLLSLLNNKIIKE